MSAVWELQTLSSTQKLVLLALADNASDEGVCWPSLTTLARKSSLALSTVKSALLELSAAGHIDRDPGDFTRSSRYLVHPRASQEGRPAAGLGRQSAEARPVDGLGVGREPAEGRPAAGHESSFNHHLEPSIQPRAHENAFEVLQAVKGAYPAGTYRQTAWMIAERAIGQLLEEGVTGTQLLDAAKAYAKQTDARGKVGTEFVLGPDRFYGKGEWKGPFPLPKAPQKPETDAAATKAWDELIASQGARRTPAVQKAIEAVGGWSVIRERSTFEHSKVRAAFIRAHIEAAQGTAA
jgi:Helix-turn-helix domain